MSTGSDGSYIFDELDKYLYTLKTSKDGYIDNSKTVQVHIAGRYTAGNKSSGVIS